MLLLYHVSSPQSMDSELGIFKSCLEENSKCLHFLMSFLSTIDVCGQWRSYMSAKEGHGPPFGPNEITYVYAKLKSWRSISCAPNHPGWQPCQKLQTARSARVTAASPLAPHHLVGPCHPCPLVCGLHRLLLAGLRSVTVRWIGLRLLQSTNPNQFVVRPITSATYQGQASSSSVLSQGKMVPYSWFLAPPLHIRDLKCEVLKYLLA